MIADALAVPAADHGCTRCRCRDPLAQHVRDLPRHGYGAALGGPIVGLVSDAGPEYVAALLQAISLVRGRAHSDHSSGRITRVVTARSLARR